MKSRTVSKMNIWPVVTFVTVLFFQIALNMFVEAPQYIPDELGAVSIGARIAGYDWTYILSKRNMYYGYGSATIFFPFFFMTKDSILLYRMLLAGGAVWRSLPVFICFKIGKDYFDIKNNLMLSALSIIGVLATPSRATRSDNEPMLVLLGWLIFYLMILIFDESKSKYKIRNVILLFAALAFSMTAHARAVGYIVAAGLTYLFFAKKTKKDIKRIVIISGGVVLAAVLYVVAQKVVKQIFYSSDAYSSDIVNNTLSAVFLRIFDVIKSFFTDSNIIINFFVLVLSNIWATVIFSCGLVPACVGNWFSDVTVYLKGRKKGAVLSPVDKALSFCIFGFIIFLVGLGFLWNDSGASTRIDGQNISRAYFYLRYIGSCFGVLIFIALCKIIRDKLYKKVWVGIVLIYLFAFKVTYKFSIMVAIDNGYIAGDYFGFIAPMTFTKVNLFDNGRNAAYYYRSTFITLAVIAVILLVMRLNKSIAVALVLIISIYYYSYSVVNWDSYHSKYWFSGANSVYDLVKAYPDAFDEAEEIYYCGDFAPEPVQFVLLDKKIIWDNPSDMSENMVILTNIPEETKGTLNFNTAGLTCIQLDEDEYIITNSSLLIDRYSQYGALFK